MPRREYVVYETYGNLALEPNDTTPEPTYWEKARPAFAVIKSQKIITYGEFIKMNLPGDNHYELIDGKIYMLAAASPQHAKIVKNLYDAINKYLEGKPCEIYPTGIGVRPEPRENDRDKDQLVPDLVVICDKSKLGPRDYEGGPDMVIEVLSPSTASKDKNIKRHKYEKAGVREYWIVSPNEQTVETFVLKQGIFMQDCYSLEFDTPPEEGVPVSIFPGLEIKLNDIFAE
ncbi:MAG: Uma2 family endonuclease [Spirochaetaceae bacterium]|jgi:Uma2 family endonuclease|nr:Uma2 family endonuclease [Spirochaetaceae bacterium]